MENSRLESVLSHTEKLCITSYYRQFSTNIKEIIRLKPVLLDQAFLKFNICGKLSIIRCDRKLFSLYYFFRAFWILTCTKTARCKSYSYSKKKIYIKYSILKKLIIVGNKSIKTKNQIVMFTKLLRILLPLYLNLWTF